MTKVIEADKGFKVWWHLTRPHTLTASFVPVFLGTIIALAIDLENIHFGLFFAMLIASMLIQAATNMFNEYYDFKRGLDNENSVGIGGTIVRHGVSPRTIMVIALAFYGVSLLLGIYICASSSWWLAMHRQIQKRISVICVITIRFLMWSSGIRITLVRVWDLNTGLRCRFQMTDLPKK